MWEERDRERLNDVPHSHPDSMWQAGHRDPCSDKDSRALWLGTKHKCAPWSSGRTRWPCRCEPVSMQSSYLKNTQSSGPTIGRSIASFLCTQDLTLFREGPAEREKQVHSLLVPPAVMACSAAVPDKCYYDILSPQLQGAAWWEQEQRALFTDVWGTKNMQILKRMQF